MISDADINDLEKEWQLYRGFHDQGDDSAAFEVLYEIEHLALARKSWPDLSAAQIAHSFLAHPDVIYPERLVDYLAERVEIAPVETRPVLRLALAHFGLTMRYPKKWWKKVPKRLMDADNPPPWSASCIVPKLAALFDVIDGDRDALLAQKVEDWGRLFSVGDPFTRACRPTLWDFAVNDFIDFAGRMKDKDEVLRSKIRCWFDGLLSVHSFDNEPDAHIHLLYRKLQLEGGDMLAFAEKWFEASAVSADAAHDAAAVLAASEKGEDRVCAHAIAERFHTKWRSSPGGRNCLRLMKSLECPSFWISTENQLRSRGKTISVTARNLTAVFFRLVPILFERIPAIKAEIDDRMWKRPKKESDVLPKLVNEEPAAEWFVLIDDPRDYVDHETVCAVPEGIPLGYYVLFAASNDTFGVDGLPVLCKIVSRTDIHLAYRKGPDGWMGFVSDAETGRPREGVAVEFKEREAGVREKDAGVCGFVSNVKSSADGLWSIKIPRNTNYGRLRARAVVPPDTAKLNWSLRMLHKCGMLDVHSTAEEGTLSCYADMKQNDTPDPRFPRVHLVTDQAVYRPGQTIRFKGYAYCANQQTFDYGVVAHRCVCVTLREGWSNPVAELKLQTNDFGTFSGEFAVPCEDPAECYVLDADLSADWGRFGASGKCLVKVKEYEPATVSTGSGKLNESESVRETQSSERGNADREVSFSRVEKSMVRVGETARLFFGTGFANAFCHVRVIRGSEILADEVREGANWVFEFPVSERHCGILHFETTFVCENRVCHEDHSVEVPFEGLRLKIVREQMNCKLVPNTRETWRFRIVDADTNEIRPGVEVLAFMYDKSPKYRKTLDDLVDERMGKGVQPDFPFCDLLPDRNGYGEYASSNEFGGLSPCSGDWPQLLDDGSSLWPDWRAEFLGVFKDNPNERGPCSIYRLDDDDGDVLNLEGGVRRCVKNDETAFFLPSLVSDEKGMVEFSFTVPQTISEWRFVLLAHDRNLANGCIDEDGIVTVLNRFINHAKPIMKG